MIGQSKQHLAAAGEGDGEHFRFATSVCLLAIAGLACLVHALVPALRTRSSIIAGLQTLFAERRHLEDVAQQSSGAITIVGLLLLHGSGIGAMAFAVPLAFLVSNPELAAA